MTWEILRKRELIINLTKLKIKYGKIEKFLSFLLTRVRFGFAETEVGRPGLGFLTSKNSKV